MLDRAAGLGEALFGVHGPGDAEVGDLDPAVGGDQHVARLHVAVDHAVAMGKGEGGGHDWPGMLATSWAGQRARFPEHGREGPAVDEFHDDEVGAGVLAPVLDRHEVGVRQVGGGLGIAPESLHKGPVDREFGKEDLEGDRSVQLTIAGAIDLGHPPAGDQVRGQFVTVRRRPEALLPVPWRPEPTLARSAKLARDLGL